MSNHRIVILAKPFVAGAANDGLEPVLGAERAAGVAQAFLIDTVIDLQRRGYRPIVAWENDGRAPRVALPGVECWSQGPGDAGQRLHNVLARATADGSIGLAIGAHTPGMPDALIEGAVRSLQDARADAVVGPAHDGGFYLLGVRHLPPGLFDEVSWASGESCESIVCALQRRNLRTTMLEPWFDVDEPNDLYRLVDLLQRGVVRAPHTAEALGFGQGF